MTSARWGKGIGVAMKKSMLLCTCWQVIRGTPVGLSITTRDNTRLPRGADPKPCHPLNLLYKICHSTTRWKYTAYVRPWGLGVKSRSFAGLSEPTTYLAPETGDWETGSRNSRRNGLPVLIALPRGECSDPICLFYFVPFGRCDILMLLLSTHTSQWLFNSAGY